MLDSKVLAFASVALIVTLTPGADTMLIIRNVIAYGRRDGFFTLAGIVSGLFVHATLSALGLSAILMRSAEAFDIVKFVGSCYLIFLGAQSIWNLIRHRKAINPHPAPEYRRSLSLRARDFKGISCPLLPQGEGLGMRVGSEVQRGWRRCYVQGLLSNVLNPKVAIFYLAFLPQFINPDDPVLAKSLLLAVIHLIEGITWLSIVILFIERMRVLFSKPSVQRNIEAVAGVILIGLGLRLATEHR